jgi:hypothetical protein
MILAGLGSALAPAEWQCEGHWLQFRGKPILLVGDSITQGWMELGTNFDQKAYVDALARRGINVILVWSYIGVVDQAADARIGYDAPEIWPWVRMAPAGPGTPLPAFAGMTPLPARGRKVTPAQAGARSAHDANQEIGVPGPFDLTRFNDAYFDRLRELLRCADANGIVVVVQVHDGWPKTKFAGHPFNVANGGPLTDRSQYVELHDYEHETPLSFDPQWTRPQKHQFYLERFCERLLQATADTPNVLFEIFNEGEWYDVQRLRAFQMHFLDFFKTRTAQPLIINDDHLRGVASFRGEPQADLLSHHTPRWDDLPPAQIYFDHYSREFGALPVKPMFFSEPVPSYEGGDAATETAILRLLWGTALAGAGVVIQNDVSFGFDPKSTMAAKADQRDRVLDLEGHVARFFHHSGVNFATMAPAGKLASTGICLARAGAEYVVYTVPTRLFTVDLTAAKDTVLGVRWYDPRAGQFHEAAPILGGAEAQPFKPPFPGDAILHLKDVRMAP